LQGFSASAKQAEASAEALEQSTKGVGTAAAAASQQAQAAANTAQQTIKGTAGALGGLSQQMQAAVNSAAQINARLNVRDTFGGAQRSADIAAWGEELSRLEAKYRPLATVQRVYQTQLEEINTLARVGMLTEKEKTTALAVTQAAYTSQTRAISLNEQQIQKSGKAALVSGYQYQNLAFQLNDVATMAAMGMDPLRILTSQAGQFYQILAMTEGGVRASVREIASVLASLITPFTVLTTVAAAFGATAVAALSGWRSAQREIEVALFGVGSAAGVTASDVNKLAEAANDAGEATVGQARSMALAFAATGKIGTEVMTDLVSIGRSVAKIYGEELEEASARLAKAFADPSRGVDELNKRFAAFDQRTVQNIKTLDTHGNRLEAQRILADRLKEAIDGAAMSTGFWARQWNAVSGAASGFWAKLGEILDRQTGGGSLEQQIESTEKLIKSLRSNDFYDTLGPLVEKEEAKLRALNEQLKRTADFARETGINLRAMEAVGLSQRISPDANQRSALEAELSILERAAASQELLNTLTAAQTDTLMRAVQVLRAKVFWHQNDFDIAIEENRYATQAITARTAAQRAQLAFDQRLSQLRREGQSTETEAIILATMARNRVLEEAAEEDRQAARERTFEHERNVEQIEQEAALVGKSASQAAGLRAEWEAIADAKRRAFETGTAVDPSAFSAAAAYGEDVRGATMRREGREMEQEQLSPADRTAQEMQRIQELLDAGAISWQTYYTAKTQAEYQAFQSTQQLLSTERDMRTRTVEMAAGLLDEFGSKSKAAAIAAIVLNKALAMASIVQDTARASMAAAASAAAGGPPAVAAAVASMQALGAVQLGIVAATGALQISQAGKKGGVSSSSRGGSSNGGSSSSPAARSSAVTATASQNVTINLVGSRYTREEVRVLINSLNDTIRDGTELKVQVA
jgi:hypothetical protein